MNATITKRPDRLYQIELSTGEVMLGPRGLGLTFEQANVLLDGLKRYTASLVEGRTLASQRLPAGGLETRSNVTTS